MSTSLEKATVVGVYGAFFIILLRHNKQILKAKPRGKLRIQYIDKKYGFESMKEHLLAIGDEVEVEVNISDQSDIQAYIIQALPRKNSFKRGGLDKLQILGANLNGVIILLSLDKPPFSIRFLDRALIEAENLFRQSEAQVLILINKMDLIDSAQGDTKERYQEILELMRYYKELGYEIFYETLSKRVSDNFRQALTNTNMNAHNNSMDQARYVLIGQSGVGKSTLLNQMAGKWVQVTSEKMITFKGHHTTTNPILFELENGVQLIDLPGVKEFGLKHLVPTDINRGFIEFQEYHCRFENFIHLEEPQCGIKEAVAANKIHPLRYESYKMILATLDEKFKPRKGDYWKGIK